MAHIANVGEGGRIQENCSTCQDKMMRKRTRKPPNLKNRTPQILLNFWSVPRDSTELFLLKWNYISLKMLLRCKQVSPVFSTEGPKIVLACTVQYFLVFQVCNLPNTMFLKSPRYCMTCWIRFYLEK